MIKFLWSKWCNSKDDDDHNFLEGTIKGKTVLAPSYSIIGDNGKPYAKVVFHPDDPDVPVTIQLRNNAQLVAIKRGVKPDLKFIANVAQVKKKGCRSCGNR